MVQELCFEKEFPRFLLIAEDKNTSVTCIWKLRMMGTRAFVNFKIIIANHNHKIAIYNISRKNKGLGGTGSLSGFVCVHVPELDNERKQILMV